MDAILEFPSLSKLQVINTCKHNISTMSLFQIILGDVNVSILNRNDKVHYKDDYEKFKLILNVIGLSMALLNLVFNYR